MIRPEILDRLVCAKYLFLLGCESLDRGGPYCAGQAVLTFQDSVEMLLRTIAEHFHAPIKDQAVFNQVLDDVEKASNQPLSHRSALIQLNRSRVNFKHLALAPRDEDVHKFRNDLEGFFPNVLKATMNLSFDELSMASLVRNRRAANWLRTAEKFLSANDFGTSIEASAVAFAVFHSQRIRSRRSSLESELRSSELPGRSDERIHPGVYRLAEAIEKSIDELQRKIEVMSNGIDYEQFRRFTDLTPQVTLTGARTLHIVDHRPVDANSYENALFCATFVARSLLKLQDGYQRRESFIAPKVDRYRVVRRGAVIVWPGDKRGEEIRDVELGEELISSRESSPNPEFVAIRQDDNCAFILSACLEKIEA